MRTPYAQTLRFTTLCLASCLAASGCSTVQSVSSGNSEPEIAQALPDDQWVRPDRIRRHIYAAMGVGASRLDPDASEAAFYNVNDRVDSGGQITLGVDLSRQLSVELHSADLGSAGFSQGGSINYDIYGASALVYAGKNRHNYRRRGLSGYGRVGVGYLENTAVGNVPFVKDNSTHVLFGAGIEYMTRLGLGLRAEGIAYDEDAQYAQLALIYRTGRKQQRRRIDIAQAPEPVVPVAKPEPEPPVELAAAIAEPEPHNPCKIIDGVLEGVNFRTNSAQLLPTATRILDGVASTLAQCTDVPVSIAAHTDSVGPEAYNQALSNRRAASVLEYLSGRGIETTRMDTQAYGETQPIDTNDTAEGRSRNRRVELIAR